MKKIALALAIVAAGVPAIASAAIQPICIRTPMGLVCFPAPTR